MRNFQLFSRRPNAAVDFRPDPDAKSPSAQVRRLLESIEAPSNPPPRDDISGCDDALAYLREYQYRKIFTATTHKEYLRLDNTDPAAIDWLLRIHDLVIDSNTKNKTPAPPVRKPRI